MMDLVVNVASGTVHFESCGYTSRALEGHRLWPWDPPGLDGDKPCAFCLPDGLPGGRS